MPTSYRHYSPHFAVLAAFALSLLVCIAGAQSVGNSGSLEGTVLDSSGAVVANAKVEIRNPVSGYDRSTTTDSAGKFTFTNIPFNRYRLTVTATGFMVYAQNVEPRSSVPVSVSVKLDVAGSTTAVTVEAEGGDRGKRLHLSHRRGPWTIRQAPARESVLVSEFAGDALDAGNLRRFGWTLPWPGRSRGELVLG